MSEMNAIRCPGFLVIHGYSGDPLASHVPSIARRPAALIISNCTIDCPITESDSATTYLAILLPRRVV